MAAVKTKSKKFPQDDYEIPLEDALDALLPPGQVDVGDSWQFVVEGDVLRITRSKLPEDVPQNSPNQQRTNEK